MESTLSETGFMANAMDYINRNISNEIRVDDICVAVGISKYHFSELLEKKLKVLHCSIERVPFLDNSR